MIQLLWRRFYSGRQKLLVECRAPVRWLDRHWKRRAGRGPFASAADAVALNGDSDER